MELGNYEFGELGKLRNWGTNEFAELGKFEKMRNWGMEELIGLKE